MRVSGDIPAVAGAEITLLVEAYRQLLPIIDQADISQMARCHHLLYVFGFDDTGALGEIGDAKELAARLKLIAQVGKYTTLPAQREKRASFLPFVGEAGRLLQTLRQLSYHHNRLYKDLLSLSYWGMMLIILLNEGTRTELLRDVVEERYAIPYRDQRLALLHDFVQSVLPDCPADEADFHELAGRLSAIQRERRAQTEAVALARLLDLPFDDDEDWQITISVPYAGSERPAVLAPNLNLSVRPDPDGAWRIRLNNAERKQFSEWDGKVTQNDLGVEGLGKGNLANFPSWVRMLKTRRGFDLDLSASDIQVGRKRSAAKKIADWLKT